MPFTTKAFLVTLLAYLATAAPAPSPVEGITEVSKRQGTIPSCYTSDSYSNLKQDKPYYENPERVSGYECTSLKKSGCSLGKSATHTVTFTQTVNGGVSSTLDLTKLIGLGADAGFAYSWSTSDASSVTDNNDCPPGGLVCGLQVSAQKVKITGHKTTEYRGGCDRKDEGDFTIYAPVLKGGDSDDQSAVQNFKICLAEDCQDDDCKKAAEAEGIEKCP